MKKNNRGITLMTLVITVTVIFILSAVAIPTGNDLLIKAQMNRYISIMYLIKTEAEKRFEDYEFDSENTDLTVNSTAEEISDINSIINLLPYKEKSLITSSGTWYKWNKSTLDYLGIDTSKILKFNDNEYFCVNYETGEVIYNSGIVIDNDNNMIYSLTGLVDYVNK